MSSKKNTVYMLASFASASVFLQPKRIRDHEFIRKNTEYIDGVCRMSGKRNIVYMLTFFALSSVLS